MKKKILLVDDKLEFRRLVKIFLSEQYEVSIAESGIHALALLQEGYIPDIIVSDLVMPHGDGKLLVNQIKTDENFQHIPIVILSSIDQSNQKVELMKLGACDYLVKPFNPQELEVRIERLLQAS